MRSCCFLFVCFFPFHESFKFLKNCPYEFHEILHSHSTPKGAPACAMASKSYVWNVRNIAKNNPKWPRNSHFSTFLIIAKTVQTIRAKFCTVILHHILVLCVQFYHICMTGIRASQKQKDLSRLLYRMRDSGLFSNTKYFKFDLNGLKYLQFASFLTFKFLYT